MKENFGLKRTPVFSIFAVVGFIAGRLDARKLVELDSVEEEIARLTACIIRVFNSCCVSVIIGICCGMSLLSFSSSRLDKSFSMSLFLEFGQKNIAFSYLSNPLSHMFLAR